MVSGVLLVGCPPVSGTPLRPELASAASSPLALSDALEKLIAEGKDTEDDRQAAYDLVVKLTASTAGDAFARAAIAGRLAERKGALALLGTDSPTALVSEAEHWALKSVKADPSFRRQAATRLLGSLYALAPANLLEGGDSEDGIGILEKLVAQDPGLTQNHLRLAEAYVALGDKDSARTPLCHTLARIAELRADELRLLDSLKKEFDDLECATASNAPETAPSIPGG